VRVLVRLLFMDGGRPRKKKKIHPLACRPTKETEGRLRLKGGKSGVVVNRPWGEGNTFVITRGVGQEPRSKSEYPAHRDRERRKASGLGGPVKKTGLETVQEVQKGARKESSIRVVGFKTPTCKKPGEGSPVGAVRPPWKGGRKIGEAGKKVRNTSKVK